MNEDSNKNTATNYSMSPALFSPRKLPCLCICCPICGVVFMATALKEDYLKDSNINEGLLGDLTRYAREGYAVAFKDAKEFKLDYCQHLKGRADTHTTMV